MAIKNPIEHSIQTGMALGPKLRRILALVVTVLAGATHAYALQSGFIPLEVAKTSFAIGCILMVIMEFLTSRRERKSS